MSGIVGYLILALVGIGLVGVMFRPQWALVLVVALYPLKQLIASYLPIFQKVSPLFNVAVFAVVLVAVLSRFVRRDSPSAGLKNGLSAVTLVLYIWATIALVWTPGNGVDRWLDGYAYWIMNALLLPMAVLTIEDFRKTLPMLLLVGILTALLFFVSPNASWYAGRLTIYMGGRGTISEIRGNPLAVGQMGGLVAIAAALMLPRGVGLTANVLRLAALMTGLALSVTSGSRAQAVFAVGTIALFYPMARRVKNPNQFFLTAAGMGLLMVLIWTAFQLALGRSAEQATRWDLSRWSESIGARVGDAMLLVNAYLDSPQHWLQGLGTNAFSYVSGFGHMSYAHNAPIEMLCELGLIGLALYIAGCYLAWRYGRQVFRLFKDDRVGRASVAALLGMCFYSWVLSMKQYTFVSMPEPWWMWLLLANVAVNENRLAQQAAQADQIEDQEWGLEAEPGEEQVATA